MIKLFKKNYNRVGILGGTFDPPHHGHCFISQLAIKKFNLDSLLWIITQNNPLKSKPTKKTEDRKKISEEMVERLNKKIEVKYLEDQINSVHTYDLVKFLKKNNNKTKFYFLMGADNFINLHKWHNWKKITKFCKIIVFDRPGYSLKCLNSIASKKLRKEEWKFIKNKKINISSSKLRKT